MTAAPSAPLVVPPPVQVYRRPPAIVCPQCRGGELRVIASRYDRGQKHYRCLRCTDDGGELFTFKVQVVQG